MKEVRLGRTEIVVPQNAFGCLPIQRDTTEVAVKLLREAACGFLTLREHIRTVK